ncbi:MAG: hypothetical protein J3Q66DRAFT_432711 [Benniella sp.]|nr:MAG: hypothetical protein J3Q66DRAFT_432711 [Benniella sp.]
MGILDPYCAATGPGNTLYVFALASTYGNSAQLPSGEYYVIAKSNANPTSLTEMTWSIVATISSSAFRMLHYIITACVVSDQGVVTIFDYNYKVIRYDPSATPNGGTASTGPGGWMQINVSNTFTLSRRGHMKSLAFYVKDTAAGGAQKLVHLTLSTPTLQFGIVDETTKTLSHAANWTITVGSSYPTVRSVAFSNNQLYVYWGYGSVEARVSVYPLTGLPRTILSDPRILDALTTAYICSDSSEIFSGVWGNSYHLLCAFRNGIDPHDTTLYTISNISQNGPSLVTGITIAKRLDHIEYFIPVAATPDFAYMVDTDPGFPGSYSIEVSGNGAGTVRESNKITVPEKLGKLDPPSKFPPPFKYDLDPDQNSDKTGLVVGVLMGIFLGLFMIYCFYKRSPDSDDEKKQAAQATVKEVHTQGHNQTEVIKNPGQATQYIVRPAEVPMAQVPGMNGSYQLNTTGQPHPAGVHPQIPGQPMHPMPQSAPIAISDAMTITPAATTVPPSQPGQDHMQYLQLSSHPRPNFVTRLVAAYIRKGILNPSCVAAGPGNTIYAFALASTYGNSSQPPRGQHYVIAKSNTNPTFFTEMTWSTVATISSSAFGMLRYITDCVVSDQGVVTVYDYDYKVIRYDPSATPNGGTASTGPGGWVNITVSNTFTLPERGRVKSLAFYVKDTAAGGAQTLIHLTLSTSTLQFWIVDETTKTLSYAASWTMSTESPERNIKPWESTLYTIDSISQGGSSIDTGITIAEGYDDIDYFIPVVATLDFAFMLETDSYFLSPGTYGIQVSGDGAGTVRELMPIIVPEAFGNPDVPSKYTYPNTTSGSTGLIFGVFIGVVVALFITIYCYRKRFSHSSNEKKKQAVVNQVSTQGHNQTEVVENPGQTTQYIVRPAEVPMIQVPGMNGPYQSNTTGQPHPEGIYPQMPGQPMHSMPQPAPTAISDAMKITPAATTVPPSQPGQDQMQYLQLSSHPRPNFVTSVGDNDQSNSQQHEVKSGPDQ